MGQYRTIHHSGLGIVVNTADSTCVRIEGEDTTIGTTNDNISVVSFESETELMNYITTNNLTLLGVEEE